MLHFGLGRVDSAGELWAMSEHHDHLSHLDIRLHLVHHRLRLGVQRARGRAIQSAGRTSLLSTGVVQVNVRAADHLDCLGGAAMLPVVLSIVLHWPRYLKRLLHLINIELTLLFLLSYIFFCELPSRASLRGDDSRWILQ